QTSTGSTQRVADVVGEVAAEVSFAERFFIQGKGQLVAIKFNGSCISEVLRSDATAADEVTCFQLEVQTLFQVLAVCFADRLGIGELVGDFEGFCILKLLSINADGPINGG